MLLQIGLLDDEGVFEFLELLKFKAAPRVGRIDAVYLRFKSRQSAFDAVEVIPSRVRCFVLPKLNLGEKSLFPFVGKSNELDIPPHFFREAVLSGVVGIIALHVLALVRATVVMVAATAFLDFALGGDAIPTRAAGGEIEKQKPLLSAMVPRLGNSEQGGLDFIELLFREHGRVSALMHFPLVGDPPALSEWHPKSRLGERGGTPSTGLGWNDLDRMVK